MSYVGIYVARHDLSIGDVYGDELEDGGNYWVHDRAGECFVTKDGENVGEAMADEIDWEATRQVRNVRMERDRWEYRFPDAKRDKILYPLRTKRDKAKDAEWPMHLRDLTATHDKMKALGIHEPTDADQDAHMVMGEDHRKLHEKAEKLADAIFDFHRDYCLSRRTPIALGIYGST